MTRPDRSLASKTWTRLSNVALAVVLPAIALAGGIDVRFDSGRLWVRTDGEVAVQQLLDSIGKRTGVEFVIDPELATGRLHVDVEGLELERGLRQVFAAIPEIGGQTMIYEPGPPGASRLARVVVFAAGHAPPVNPAEAAGGDAESVVVAIPTPPPPDLELTKKQMIDRGIAAETAQKFVDITSETARLRKTPGAAEAFIRSERYREVMREIAEAQGKKQSKPTSP